MSVIMMKKPTFNAEQIISASKASKTLGKVRKNAKEHPQAIMDNGKIDSVILDYKYYEELYLKVQELEEKEEIRILEERVNRLEQEPQTSVPWADIKKS